MNNSNRIQRGKTWAEVLTQFKGKSARQLVQFICNGWLVLSDLRIGDLRDLAAAKAQDQVATVQIGSVAYTIQTIANSTPIRILVEEVSSKGSESEQQ